MTLANYNGTCPECGGRIRAGVDRIEPDEAPGQWRHVACPDLSDEDAQAKKLAPCGRCGLLHPGEC